MKFHLADGDPSECYDTKFIQVHRSDSLSCPAISLMATKYLLRDLQPAFLGMKKHWLPVVIADK